MSILAIDFAKQTGHARLNDDQTISSGSKSFAPRQGETVRALFGKWDTWLELEIAQNKTTFISYELVKFEMGRAWTQIYHGMVGITMAAAYRHGIEIRGYPVADIKIAATGKGNAKKPAMVAAAAQMWPEQNIIDDNQADALWILYICMRDLGIFTKKNQSELF